MKQYYRRKTKKKVMVSLSHDVMLGILSRLPVKTLTRFRCVSKSWGNIISDPYFLDLHHMRSKQNFRLFLISDAYDCRGDEYGHKRLHFTSLTDKGEELYKFTAMEDGSVHLVLPACGDLVCFPTRERIYLCNPSTRELLPLPKGSFISFGFGYLPSTKTYKLVRLFYRDHAVINNHTYDTIKCEIFTFGCDDDHGNISFCTSSWRVLEENCPYNVDGNSYPAFVNDTIYWKICPYDMEERKEVIVSFNTVSEKFQTCGHPLNSPNTCNNGFMLTELRGMLGMVTKANSIMVIWMLKLKDEKSSIWEKGYTINMVGLYPDFSSWVRPITMRDGEIILLSSSTSIVCFYNIENESFGMVKLPKQDPKFSIYWESLVSLRRS